MPKTPAIEGGQPTRPDFLPFAAPLITEAEIAEVVDTLRSGWLATGKKTAAFEEQFAAYSGNRFGIAVNSGTAALALALEVAGVGPGDEVVTTPMTFVATAHQVLCRGATPVFADVDARTFNILPGQAEALFTARTRALLVVHFAGRPCDMQALRRIADTRGVPLISDAAHAIESLHMGKKLATWSDLSAYSFHPSKNVTTGEGGMVTTDNEPWSRETRCLRFHGIDRDALSRHGARAAAVTDVTALGYKYNMSDLQAGIGIHQLRAVEQNWQRRDELWGRYVAALSGCGGLALPPPCPEGDRHAKHMFNVLLDIDRCRLTRDEFCAALKRENIGAGVHYPSVHRLAYYARRFGIPDSDLPSSSFVSDRILTLPLHAGMSDHDCDSVVSAVSDLVDYYTNA